VIPSGSTCTLRYHWKGKVSKAPRAGDVLKTRTGRRYMIISVSGQLVTSLGLKVLVMHEDDELPEGARVYGFAWDKRGK